MWAAPAATAAAACWQLFAVIQSLYAVAAQLARCGRGQHIQQQPQLAVHCPTLPVAARHTPPPAPATPLLQPLPYSSLPPAQLGNDYDGFRSTYDDGPQQQQPKRRAANATGGLPLGSAAAAVAAAGALAGPTLQRCELCAATFGSERELALHLEGAAHRQAVARAEAEAERRRRLGAYADVAASAVQAAVWQSGGASGRPAQRPLPPSAAAATGGNAMALGGSGSGAPAPPPQQGGRGGGGRGRGGGPQQQQQQQGRGRGQPSQPAPPAVHARNLTSHEEMLKQARGGDKTPLDLDGWVPPTVPQPAAAAPAAAAQQQEQAQPQSGAAGASEQQADAEQQEGLLGGLVSYGEAEAASDQDAGAPQQQQAQQQEGSSSSDGSGSDSESDGGGGGAPAAFFTF